MTDTTATKTQVLISLLMLLTVVCMKFDDGGKRRSISQKLKHETETLPVADACPKKEIHNKKTQHQDVKKDDSSLQANRASGDSIHSPRIARALCGKLHTRILPA
jgi:hypothetical protein